jgi:hypothetical protein
MQSQLQQTSAATLVSLLFAIACSNPDATVSESALGPALCAVEVSSEPAVAVLPEGRLALTVPGEKRVQVLDSLCSTVAEMGRVGAGPGEYQVAARPFVDTEGGLHVLDPVLQRVTHYNAGGEYLGATAVTAGPNVESLMMAVDGAVFSIAPLTGVDDSVSLVVHRALDVSDAIEIGRLHRPVSVLVPLGEIAINTPPEYTPFDAWGTLPGGEAWVARGADNRLELIRDDSRISGPPVPFARIETVPADRDRWRGLPAPERFRVSARPLSPLKAPFQGVVRADDGEYWMWLNQPAGHSSELYACRTLESSELLRVIVPNAHKVLAVGPDRVYVYGEDADGTPMLSAHSRPRCAR